VAAALGDERQIDDLRASLDTAAAIGAVGEGVASSQCGTAVEEIGVRQADCGTHPLGISTDVDVKSE
jgi:hypothetical protein